MERTEIIQIIPENLLVSASVEVSDIIYCMKLSGIAKRRSAAPAQNRFSGIMTGIGNAINDTISSVTNDAYLVRTDSGKFVILTSKTAPMSFGVDATSKNINIGEDVKIAVTFPSGDIESGAYKLSLDSVSKTFCGSIKQLLADFGNVRLENMADFFVTVITSKHIFGTELYKFNQEQKLSTLFAYDNRGITLLNARKRIEFSSVLAYYFANGYYELLIRDGNEFELVEIYENADAKPGDSQMNLIRHELEKENGALSLCLPEGIARAESYLAAFQLNDFAVVAIDNNIYALGESGLLECGIFRADTDIYVKTSDGVTKKFAGFDSVTDVLTLLPYGYDGIFTTQGEPQPFIRKGEIKNFIVTTKEIKSDDETFSYAQMQDCTCDINDFGAMITFTYDEEQVELYTSNSLGVYICNLQEKVFVSSMITDYNINQLYDCFYKRCNKNFLAGTFAEIFKTEKLLNAESSLDELITAIKAEESAVLRSAAQSVLGKFKNVDDIQSELIQKVALLEIQRKKIQKMFDEWLLYYPHYMATMQVKWLKYIFPTKVSGDMLNTEYWKCVSHYKRILSSGNSYVQKNMNEIGSCIGKINSALPEDVKRIDITDDLRINSNNTTAKLNTGVDLMMGVTAGVELANMLIRGFNATSPLSISLSAKMLVDSYTKDMEMRKNVKAFGLQSLEWWRIFMNGIRIQIMELSNGVNDYNKICLKRDTDIFMKLPNEAKEKVKAKLTTSLKDKIEASIDDKFMEVLPQFNMRISNIINEIDSNSDFLNLTLDEFKNNLFI